MINSKSNSLKFLLNWSAYNTIWNKRHGKKNRSIQLSCLQTPKLWKLWVENRTLSEHYKGDETSVSIHPYSAVALEPNVIEFRTDHKVFVVLHKFQNFERLDAQHNFGTQVKLICSVLKVKHIKRFVWWHSVSLCWCYKGRSDFGSERTSIPIELEESKRSLLMTFWVSLSRFIFTWCCWFRSYFNLWHVIVLTLFFVWPCAGS